MTSANVTWHEGVVGRGQRWKALGARGATIWFTGLPASGKSTIATVPESANSRATSAVRRTFSSRSLALKPRSPQKPWRRLSPSSR